jgi:hypothetical protein
LDNEIIQKAEKNEKKYSMSGQEITVTEMKKSSGHIIQLLGYQSYKFYYRKKKRKKRKKEGRGTSKGEGMKKEL